MSVATGGVSTSNQESDENDALLLEEARKDWEARGYKAGDFTVEKMVTLWAEEDEKQLGATDRITSNLGLKQELLEVKRQAEVSPDEMVTFVKRKAKEAGIGASQWLVKKRDKYTPEFIRRQIQWRSYQKNVQQELVDAADLRRRKLATIEEAMEEKRKQKAYHDELRERVQAEADIRSLAKDSKMTAMVAEKQHRLERIHERRQRLLEEKLRAAQLEKRHKEQAVSAKLHRKRIQDYHKWTQQRQAAEALKRAAEDEAAVKAASELDVEAEMEVEVNERRKQLESDEAFVPTGISPLFPLKAGSEAIISGEDIDPEEGKEEVVSALFDDFGVNPRIEAMQVAKMEARSLELKLSQREAALLETEDSVMQQQDTLFLESLLVRAQRDGIVADIQAINAKFVGPPRREAGDHEVEDLDRLTKLQFDLRVSFEETLAKEKQKCERTLDQLRSDITDATSERKRASETMNMLSCEIETRLSHTPQLPFVIGKGLERPSKFGITMPLSARADAVVFRSQTQLLEEAAEQLDAQQEDLKRLSHKQWKLREGSHSLRHELELSKSHLADTEARLSTATNMKQRQDLVDALKQFFLHGGHIALLQAPNETTSGELDWWNGRFEKSSEQIEMATDVVKACSSSAVCQGWLALPKHRLWMLTLQFHCSKEVGDEVLIVNLGKSPLSMFSVGRIHSDGTMEQELRVPFIGGTVAYRFKFVSKSGKSYGSIALKVGHYAVFAFPALEDKGGGTVCSSLVRELSLELVQGKARTVKLLEELDKVNATSSQSAHFDSEILQGTPQRYRKDHLKSLLHTELMKEVQKFEKEAETIGGHAAAFEDESSEKVRKALERHIQRKRKGYDASAALEMGEDLVGKKLEIYDAETHRWKVGTVQGMRSRWVDQNTRLEITHKVTGLQARTEPSEATDFEELQQEEALWQDLLSQKFVELDADEEELEEQRKARGKSYTTFQALLTCVVERARREEAKRRKAALAALEKKRQKAMAIAQAEKAKKREMERQLEDEMAAASAKAREDAQRMMAKPAVAAYLSSKVPKILADFKSGVFTKNGANIDVNEEEALFFAKQNFEDSYVARAEDEVQRKWAMRIQLFMAEVTARKLATANEHAKEEAAAQVAAERRRCNLSEKMGERLQRFGESFKLRNFSLALQPYARCVHKTVKYWGDEYGHGMKCMQCGSELSSSYENIMQVLESNDELGAMVFRHRIDAGTCGQESTAQAKVLEAERLRVEKEARLLEVTSTRRLPPPAAVTPLAWLQPSRWRNQQLCKLWEEDLALLSRCTHFQTKTAELRCHHDNLINERHLLLDRLGYLHGEGRLVTDLLSGVEQEHLESEELLERRANAQRNVQRLRKALRERLASRASAEAIHCAKEEEACIAEADLAEHSRKLEGVLLIQQELRDRDAELKQEVDDARRALDEAEGKLRDTGLVLRKLGCSAVGNVCDVPRWGRGKIVHFRVGNEKEQTDDIVKVKICWGGCMDVVVSVRAILVAEAEIQGEEQEKRLMAMEDECNRACAVEEKLRAAGERRLMEQEEVEQEKLEQLENAEAMRKREMGFAIENSRKRALEVLELPWKKAQLERLAEEFVNDQLQRLVNENVLVFEVSKKRAKKRIQLAVSRLSDKFVSEQVELGSREAREAFAALEETQTLNAAIEAVYHEMTDAHVARLAEAEAESSRLMAYRRMIDSGIFVIPFSSLRCLNVGVFSGLAKLWRTRRHELRAMQRMWAHREELARIRAAELLAMQRYEEERFREEQEAKAMRRAEVETRRFYQMELSKMLAARWALADAEREMRTFLREEAVLLAKSKYDVVGAQEDKPEARKMRLRKDELKKQIADKQRAKREQTGMAKEDDLATRVRAELLRSVQRIKLEAELRMAQGDVFDEGDLDETVAKELRAAAEKERKRVERERAVLEARLVEAFAGRVQAELAEMDAIEQQNRAEIGLQTAARKLLKCDLWVRNGLRDAQKLERKTRGALKEREEWALQAENVALEVDELRPALETAERECLETIRGTRYMASRVIHSCAQTFDTDNLFQALHARYFSLIVGRIALDAETICLEKQLRVITGRVQSVGIEIARKDRRLLEVKREHLRESRMNMWRSELCKLLFGKARRWTLQTVMTEWHLVAMKVTRVRNSFAIRSQLALRRVAQADLKPDQLDPGQSGARETLMHRLTNRIMECVNCKAMFTQNSNHSQACAYHDGDYKFACPRTCTRKQSGAVNAQSLSVSPKCMAHYCKRWTCCDQTKVIPFSRDGCKKRWHVPPETDVQVDAIAKQRQDLREKSAKVQGELDQRLRKWKAINHRMRSEEMERMRERVEADRDMLKQFKPRDYS